MRQKADKLEKGKWYADTMGFYSVPTFFRFEFGNSVDNCFDLEIGDPYPSDQDGKFRFPTNGSHWYLPTPEDIEKYNLNEEE